MTELHIDRRVERTRGAILDSFAALFFANGFDSVDVQQVAANANVGRSTFYRHFRSKDDLLVQSLSPFFAEMADACVNDGKPEGLALVLAHFWENRRLARAVFTGRSMTLVVRSLANMIERRLAELPAPARSQFPVSLVAAQLAAGNMTMIDEWLRGRGSSTSEQMTDVLHAGSRALVRETLTSRGGE